MTHDDHEINDAPDQSSILLISQGMQKSLKKNSSSQVSRTMLNQVSMESLISLLKKNAKGFLGDDNMNPYLTDEMTDFSQ
jgi:hypothetical protein